MWPHLCDLWTSGLSCTHALCPLGAASVCDSDRGSSLYLESCVTCSERKIECGKLSAGSSSLCLETGTHLCSSFCSGKIKGSCQGCCQQSREVNLPSGRALDAFEYHYICTQPAGIHEASPFPEALLALAWLAHSWFQVVYTRTETLGGKRARFLKTKNRITKGLLNPCFFTGKVGVIISCSQRCWGLRETRYRAACIKQLRNVVFLNQPFIPTQQRLNKGGVCIFEGEGVWQMYRYLKALLQARKQNW